MERMRELESALIKADAAGNVDDARILANEIRRMRAEQAQMPSMDSTQTMPASQQDGPSASRLGFQPRPQVPIAEFPDGTSREVMQAALRKRFPPPAPKESDGFWRQQGLGLRNVVEGVTDVAGIATNPLMYGVSKLTGQPYQSFTESAGQALDAVGVPRPRTADERVIGDVGRAITGAGLTMGAGGAAIGARGAAGEVGRALTAGPKTQIAGAGLGAGAAGSVRERGGTPGQQMAAGLIGGILPSGAGAVASGGSRLAIRGGEAGRKAVESNIATFNRAGTEPTVGQATQGRTMQGLESLLSKAPGSAGVMAKKASAQQTQIGARVEDVASELSPRSSSTLAGRAIERGVSGDGGFLDTFQAKSRQLYNEVDKYIPPQTGILAKNTQDMLAKEAAPIPGARNVSEYLANPKLAGIRESLNADIIANSGVIPYTALKQVRSKVGEMISDGGLVSDIPTKALKRLYGALSADMAEAVKATGDSGAMQAFNRANNHFRVGMGRIDMLESVVGRNGGPEAVFGAAMTGSKEGATKLRAVMQSLPLESQKQVTSALVRRMGRAVNSRQDDLGEQFSVNTFLTNWNAMSKEARSAAFGRYGPKFSQDMDQIAKAAANVREGSAVFANPPGTAAAGAQIGSVGSLVFALANGYYKTAAGIAVSMAATNIFSKWFTSPKRVAWLARNTTAPIQTLGNQAVILAGIARAENDQELEAFAEELKMIGNNGNPKPNNRN